MKAWKTHEILSVSQDNRILCIGIIEDILEGKFYWELIFPVYTSKGDMLYRENSNYSREELIAIENSRGMVATNLADYGLKPQDKARGKATLKEAVQEGLSYDHTRPSHHPHW